ncbi:hypothetical protein AAGS61_11210 [Lysinibacillus sp. KU-BSD001]|uniref:hypothetical protein n=1 Tax=Lysinibacillus sp. KU-BSD001 TaxID=3141328 RepID=UPI0036E0B488
MTLTIQKVPFTEILKHIDLRFFEFNMNRCDERTLYVSISISSKQGNAICDLIYLIDKNDLYGAISLNEKYDTVRNFFKTHFNYDLLYSDEQIIAKMICQTKEFKHCLERFAKLYPKHVQSKFFH